MKTKLQSVLFLEQIKQKTYWNNLGSSFNRSVVNNIFSTEQRNSLVIEGQSGKSTIDEICLREEIAHTTFQQWTQEFLNNEIIESKTKKLRKNLKEEDKFTIVIEGKTGETSIAELCKRENITQDIFLEWSKDFLDLRKNKLQEINKTDLLVNKCLLINLSGEDTYNYLENYIDFSDRKLSIIKDFTEFEVNTKTEISNIICFQKTNDIRYINKYFENINGKLPVGGMFVGCFETLTARKERLSMCNLPLINNIYFSVEFIVKRILPKLSFTKKHYFDITKGNDRLLSKAEALGRLVSSGFKIMDYKNINGLVFFVVKKEGNPTFDQNPSYGPIYKMPRIGENGKIIKVYKFRTMHPYSEYLQDYVLRANGYSNSGKPANDFRIPVWGRFMRKFWLDELPQLINVFKGEMKLVGIRPVSKRYFQDIPKEMQKLRLTQKPGCIPPYVALNRSGNVMSVLQSEKEYLEEKIKKPNTTDIKYFFNAIFNIIFNHKRSA